MDEPTVSWFCPCGAHEFLVTARLHRMVVDRLKWFGEVVLTRVLICASCGGSPRPIMPSREGAKRG